MFGLRWSRRGRVPGRLPPLEVQVAGVACGRRGAMLKEEAGPALPCPPALRACGCVLVARRLFWCFVRVSLLCKEQGIACPVALRDILVVLAVPESPAAATHSPQDGQGQLPGTQGTAPHWSLLMVAGQKNPPQNPRANQSRRGWGPLGRESPALAGAACGVRLRLAAQPGSSLSVYRPPAALRDETNQ